MIIKGHIADLHGRTVFPGEVVVEDGRIVRINRTESAPDCYILPGFVDAHVHIESSMLTPFWFSRFAAANGTVAVVTDPHEIANVVGEEGIDFMLENRGDIKTFYTIPSCVPATSFDSAGAVLDAAAVERLAASGRFVALSEVMNVPGVVNRDPEVMAKIQSALSRGLPVDGHAPMLHGDELRRYAAAGISTDHECSTINEAKEKIALGMKILIREGSAARNYEALSGLIKSNPESVMFCTDDSHPDTLECRHIDHIVRQAVSEGYDVFDVLRAASLNPVEHYRLPVGLLREGDPADFIVVDNLTDFRIDRTYVGGSKVYDRSEPRPAIEIPANAEEGLPNKFSHDTIAPESLALAVKEGQSVPVIKVYDGELITGREDYTPQADNARFESDTSKDILKIVYLNRYENGTPQVALVHGFGLAEGALASSVGHDSHNIVAVGASDAHLAAAINAVIEAKGGLAVATADGADVLPLPIAGIMSPLPGKHVADEYRRICEVAKALGTSLKAPFMTLAFMSLVVIPSLKIGERGLFDYEIFNWINENQR